MCQKLFAEVVRDTARRSFVFHAGVITLAVRKPQVDGLLGRRREQDHEATTSLKTEFMQLWVSWQSAVSLRSPCGSRQ